MLSTSLTAFANSYNFTVKENLAFGVIHDYLVTVSNNGSKKNAFISCCFPTNEECQENKNLISTFQFQNEIGKIIDSDCPELRNYEITIESISFSTSADLKTFDYALLKLLDLLSKNDIPGEGICVKCGAENNADSKFVIESNVAHMLCAQCTEEYANKIKEQSTTKQESSYVRGTGYAVLGTLLGTLITMGLFMFIVPAEGFLGYNGLVACIPCAALITLLSFLFYRLFTGVKSLERILPCLIVSAIFTALTIYLSTVIMYAKSMGISAFNNAETVFGIIVGAPFNDPYYSSEFYSHIFYSFVAVIIVVLIYSIVFEDKNKNQIEILDQTPKA